MKYLVFAGYIYYPTSGFGDFKKAFYNYEEAMAFCDKLRESQGDYEWVEIVNLDDYIYKDFS